MAGKNSNSSGTASQNNTSDSAPASTPKRNTMLYVTIIIAVVAVVAIAYYLLSGSSGQSLTNKQVFNNVSSTSLNRTQSLFVNDLKKSENVSDLEVSYYYSNATRYIKESSNLTIAVSSNQTINSYKMGSYNKSVIASVIAYTNSNTGEVIEKNVSDIYYYNTNTTVTCFNDTAYTAGLVTNSSLQCGSGDQGLTGIEEAPFVAANVSSLSYLVFNNTVTYGGTKTIAGRTCDDFIISNATAANLQSNYSVFNMCVDTQYGILLYTNQTFVTGGIPSTFTFVATSVSTNVPSSEFVIPQQYLSTISKSII